MGQRAIQVATYDPSWASDFQALRARLRKILRRARIEHVGSTAVPGGHAKATVDISVGLRKAERLRIADAESIGLEFRSVSSDSTHFVFRNRSGNHVAHVHVNPRNSEAELRLLRFRDYLRAHPEVVAKYVAVKIRIVDDLRKRTRYTSAKATFIQNLEPHVIRWAKRTKWESGRPRRVGRLKRRRNS